MRFNEHGFNITCRCVWFDGKIAADELDQRVPAFLTEARTRLCQAAFAARAAPFIA